MKSASASIIDLATYSSMASSCIHQVATSSLGGRSLVTPVSPRKHCPVASRKVQLKSSVVTPMLTLTASKRMSVTRSKNGLMTVAEAVTTTSETEIEAELSTEEEAVEEVQLPSTPKRKKTRGLQHIMETLNQRAIETFSEGKTLPDLRTGDIVQLRLEVLENKKRVSLLRGIVMAKHSAGINTTFRIRRIIAGVGVEMVFPLYSPNIKEIKVINRRKVRRAKLYYLRHKLARLSTV